jgi:hypothetical protein
VFATPWFMLVLAANMGSHTLKCILPKPVVQFKILGNKMGADQTDNFRMNTSMVDTAPLIIWFL